MRLSRLAAFAAISTLTFGASAQAQELPEGQGKAAVLTACTQCHGIDVIVRQPRSRDEWMDVVSRMVGNGAQLSDDDYNLVIEYLATDLGSANQKAPAKGQSASAPPAGNSRN